MKSRMAVLGLAMSLCAANALRVNADPQADLAPTPPMGWNSFDSYGVHLHEKAALAASPLMVGGDLPSLDDESLALITNDQMLACNQNGVMGKCLFDRDGVEVCQVLKKGQPDTGWVGVFNRSEEAQCLAIPPAMLGLDAGAEVQVLDV